MSDIQSFRCIVKSYDLFFFAVCQHNFATAVNCDINLLQILVGMKSATGMFTHAVDVVNAFYGEGNFFLVFSDYEHSS